MLVITGAGTVFSAGGNVKDMVDRAGMFGGSPVEVFRGYRYGIQRIPLAVDGVEVPTICAVNGPAIGAGCDLAFMCDLRIASDQARFRETFVNLGIVPGDGGTYFLPRAVGAQKAAEMMFTGGAIPASEALEAGLVLKVVSPAKLMPATMVLAAEIARKPPVTIRLAKLLYRQGLRAANLPDFLELSAAFQALCHHTEEHIEAVRDFSARAREGSGTILRRGVAISVSPQTASTHIEASQARELQCGTAALSQVPQPAGQLLNEPGAQVARVLLALDEEQRDHLADSPDLEDGPQVPAKAEPCPMETPLSVERSRRWRMRSSVRFARE